MIVILSGASARFSAIRGFCGSRGRAVEGAVVQRGCNTDAEIRYSTPPIKTGTAPLTDTFPRRVLALSLPDKTHVHQRSPEGQTHPHHRRWYRPWPGHG